MKIKLLFLNFCALTLLANAQAPINNYFSTAMSQYAAVTGTIDHSPSGAGVSWVFDPLSPSGTNVDTYMAPTAAQLATYPNTTEVLTITDGSMNENQFFYELAGSTLSLTGASNAEFSIDYNTDNALIGTYPLTFGTAPTVDAIAGQLMAQGQSPTYTGTITTEVDAYGMLDLEVTGLGSYNGSITRVRTEQNIGFTIAGFFPGTLDIVSYNYYKDDDGALVFRSTDGAIVVNGLGINETFATNEALITNTLTTDENQQALDLVKLYPNPADVYLNVELSASETIASITIIDVNGKTVLTTINKTIYIDDLTAGLYFVNITTNKTAVTKKFIKK